jgi:acyl phosphate:glycerol-3-phosphate acyltransferase
MLLWLLANTGILLLAYLLGSVPSGFLAGKWLKGIDIRDHGSGSMGATNVLRSVGKLPAVGVLLLDALKGSAAIFLTQLIYSWGLFRSLAPVEIGLENSSQFCAAWVQILAGLAALIGHSKPIWLNFKGGKSVASSLGVLVALSWPVAMSTFGVFAVTLAVTRIVSMSSILGAISTAVWMYLFKQPFPYLLFAIVGGPYVIWLHRSNIQRLLAGTEPQLGQKLPEQTQN